MLVMNEHGKIYESVKTTDEILDELREYSINTTMPVVPHWDSYIEGATAITNYAHSMSRAGNYISVLITPTKNYIIDKILVMVDDKQSPYYLDENQMKIEEDGDKRIVHFIMPANNVDVSCEVKSKPLLEK